MYTMFTLNLNMDTALILGSGGKLRLSYLYDKISINILSPGKR